VVTASSVAMKWLHINGGNIGRLVHRTLVGVGRHELVENARTPQGNNTLLWKAGDVPHTGAIWSVQIMLVSSVINPKYVNTSYAPLNSQSHDLKSSLRLSSGN
jgi:hypothetical protein